MLDRMSLPQGVKDFPPQRAEEVRRIQNTLLEEFSRWGYRAVITPLFESLDTILAGLGENLRDKVLKFVDPTTGEVAALRPDITPQVARMVALELKNHEVPLRLCYSGKVVRFEEKGSGREREIFQVGCELIGAKGAEADAEIMALAVKSLERLGIKNVILDIGHTGFLRQLLAATGEAEGEIEEALKKKDTEALARAVSSADLPPKVSSALLALPELFGDRSILKRALSLPLIGRYAREVEQVLSLLDDFSLNCGVNIDFGEVRGFTYYTGMTFELLSPHSPYPLVRGGRYDQLLRSYGHDLPGAGFAVDVESVGGVARGASEDHHVHFIVIPKRSGLRREAIMLAQWLRSSGFRVVLEMKPAKITAGEPSSGGELSYYGIILIESPKRLKMIESRSGSIKEFSNLEDLLKGGGI
ncbi:MAG: ATP phosphoribosyltransferase regulatory subunit [Candidatus Methanosuratincola sp.]|jgi:ATP phosphoribosyltransferase regulatory subunit